MVGRGSRMSVLVCMLLASAVLSGPAEWVLAPAPPDSSSVREALEADPMGVLLVAARTGWFPDWLSPDSLAACLGEDPSRARTAAWATRMAGHPFASCDAVPMMEFGATTLLPTEVQAVYRPELMDAALRRVLHAFAENLEPDSVAPLVQRIGACWDLFPDNTRSLSLEVLGRLRVDLTGVLDDDQVLLAGLRASARYWSETGRIHSFPMAGECLPLEAAYIAACAPPWEAAGMLSDPRWTVRFRALGRCSASDAGLLLDDPVPYIALTAAVVRRDSGFTDGGARLRELAAVPGPVGVLAAGELCAGDSVLLAELMREGTPAIRAAAQSAWLADSLPVSASLEEAWISDPYWLVPMNWAWQRVDSGDSLGAERVLNLLLEHQGSTDRSPELLEEAVGLLGLLHGEVADAPSVSWRGFELPFGVDSGGPSTAILRTDAGDFTIDLWDEVAPIACAGFRYLAETGFYDGIEFHRVIPGFVAQGGCPEGNGMGGPGYELPGEPSMMSFDRGVLGMADAGPGTAGSQFFIMLDHHGRLDGRYTAFGRIREGCPIDDITVGTVISGITLID
jgi:peptidyl-prolyl cis-trans isomerase B (cyclophilin B)